MDDIIKRIAQTPAIGLEKTVKTIKALGKKQFDVEHFRRVNAYWETLGPGLVTGAADDDPSGIATYSQTGAKYGFQLLWLAGFTLPLMTVVQEMCARLGLMTGRGLAGNIRINYGKWVHVCALFLLIANTLNIGADIAAMSESVQLLNPHIPFIVISLSFTLFCMLMQIYVPYHKYANFLKYLVFVLFAYVAAALLSHLDIRQLIIHSMIPSITFSKDQILLITGVLGTTISPYLFFWQTSHEIEEEINNGKTTIRLREGTNDREIRNMRIDTFSGMFISNLIMFFIIAACAATLFSHGITNITSAAQAASALKPFAGDYAFLLFTVGIIGTGLLAVPILAGSAAYTVAEGFKWKSGLFRKLEEARAFYGMIMISTSIGFILTLLGIDPIKLLLFSAVVNGLVAPLILFFIVRMTSRRRVMRDRVNGPISMILGSLILILMIIAGIATIVSLFVG
jgi:NRAMP (natural resistance-associated macrophage protein)-like metal ion transporter